MIKRTAMLKSMIGNSFKLQKNGTPRIKPINNGGSPTGVRQPPRLETMKIKKMMICRLRLRQLLARMIGRIMTMLAPVVPIQLDNRVPSASMMTFSLGPPINSPSRTILPATQNKPKSRTIKVR